MRKKWKFKTTVSYDREDNKNGYVGYAGFFCPDCFKPIYIGVRISSAAQMLSMQEKEGAALAVDLNSRLDLIEQRLQVIREAAPLVVAEK